MARKKANVIHAAARIDGTAAPAAFLANRGFSAIADNGVGDHTLTFDRQIDSLEAVVLVTRRGTQVGAVAGGFTYGTVVTDTTVQILCADGTAAGAVARDSIYDVLVLNPF